ncbi:KH domain-containing protein [Brevibacillus sp. B_LB10_24]|uniref:KH domain-containing protein n=1 Tax=Brevibacillus sp. B_LB10_24 TaxID=3380645 RepID=UPI0038BBEC80
MKELVETIAKALVDHPEEIRVNAVEKDRLVVFELSVHPEDMGKIIGKQGRIAKALRTVVSAAAVQTDKRVTVEIV